MPTGYARGWTLLRSSGGANRTEPCAPLQERHSCECSSRDVAALTARLRHPSHHRLPRCRPTAGCRAANAHDRLDEIYRAPTGPRLNAAIAFAIGVNASALRFYQSGQPEAGYSSQVRLALRLVLSLRAVNTSHGDRVSGPR